MKPSRPLNKGNKKFIITTSSRDDLVVGAQTGSLIITKGEKTAFIGLPRTNTTVGVEFLKVLETGNHVVLSMSARDGFIKGLFLSQMDGDGTLRIVKAEDNASELVM